MSESDLLNLAHSCSQTISSDFAQIVTITFAMVVAIYYFLHRAGIRMKIFAFVLYTSGMLMYLGMMITESNVLAGAQRALHAIPASAQSLPTQSYLSVRSSWVGLGATFMLNFVYWFLWLGTTFLLFFWKNPGDVRAKAEKAVS
jgi:hypothetical protein